MKAVFLLEPDCKHIQPIFGNGRYEQYAELMELPWLFVHPKNLEEHKDYLKDVTIAVSTWGIPYFSSEEIQQYLPSLKLLLYVAGTVQHFARPFLENGVRICTAGEIMNTPVAEFTLAAILHANKGVLRSYAMYREEGWHAANSHFIYGYPGTYYTKVGILGAGRIGSLVIKMLKNHLVNILVFDPFLSDERAKELGVQKAGLEEIFSTCQTISCHLADNPQTRGLLDYRLFSMMKDNATFVNTGRGAQVVEADLLRALHDEPNRSAVLDVTDPEPADGSVILHQPNIFVSPHLAGTACEENYHLTDGVLEIFKEFLKTGTLRAEVTESMLATMA